jgi:hypothetical protein
MAELDVTIQPYAYRTASKPPAWAFFHHLRLLLGWGEGLWETLGDRMNRVRAAFVIFEPSRTVSPTELGGYIERVETYRVDKPRSPFCVHVLRQGEIACSRLHTNDLDRSGDDPATHALHGPEAHHALKGDARFRVAHSVEDDQIVLTIERHYRVLNPGWTPVLRFDRYGLLHL